ncbi:MAG: hypothetical protein WCW63_01955 [Acholeplasmataceae bacterium]
MIGNYSGHYLQGRLFAKDRETLIDDFKYAIIMAKTRQRDTALQGVSANQEFLTIEVVCEEGIFTRQMYVELKEKKYMIEEIENETPVNEYNPDTLYFVKFRVKK